jgi:hypothetical protein
VSAIIKLGISSITKVEPKDLVVSRPVPPQREFRRIEEPRRTVLSGREFRRIEDRSEPLYQDRTSNRSGMAALPRWCSIHDRKYVAWYRHVSGGRYAHTNTARLTADIVRGGFSGDLIATSVKIVGESVEICPFCGTSGYEAVHCNVCGQFVCYGRSDGDYYFRCRASCTGEGRLVRANLDIKGVVPRMW